MSNKIIKISVPGSKSITNRVLPLLALSKQKTILKNIGICDDTMYMTKALKKLKFTKQSKPIKIFTGNAGTTTRFLTAFSTLTKNKVIITGDSRMNKRPIGELTKALNLLGAKVETKNVFPPITIHPQKIQGGKIHIPGNISSQYISALLITLPFAKKNSELIIDKKLLSKPYIEITLKVLQQFKIKIVNKNFAHFKIQGNQKISAPKTFVIESDASSASYSAAYTALHPGKSVLLKNIHKNSIQGDIKFLDFLKKMGCKISHKKEGTQITSPKILKSLGTVDMNGTPDLVMTFAVLAMFVKGKTRITNIANLKIKESDRISALESEISKFKVRIKTSKDFIEITGDPSKLKNTKSSILINTYNDHRIAMSFGILTDLIPNLKIENPNCVRKSYTTFWKDLKKIQKS